MPLVQKTIHLNKFPVFRKVRISCFDIQAIVFDMRLNLSIGLTLPQVFTRNAWRID